MQLNEFEINLLCPVCGIQMEKALHPRSLFPGPGDFAVCMTCRGVSRYHQTVFGVHLRVLTDGERVMVQTQPQYRGVRQILAAYDQDKRRR